MYLCIYINSDVLFIFIGGTADITVHEQISKSFVMPAVGDCGGTSIDNAFIQMIVKILGAPMITLLKQKDPPAYLDLLREFETVKRRIETDTTGKMNFTIPCVLRSIRFVKDIKAKHLVL